MTVSRFGGIEGATNVGALYVGQDPDKGIGEYKRCRRVHTRRRQAGITDQGEVAPVGQGHAIEKIESRHGSQSNEMA